MNRPFIVVTDDEVIGEFSQLEGAEFFCHYVALHSYVGDKISIYELKQTIEVLE